MFELNTIKTSLNRMLKIIGGFPLKYTKWANFKLKKRYRKNSVGPSDYFGTYRIIPSLCRCPLVIQCTIRESVSNLRLFLLRLLWTLNLPRPKSPSIYGLFLPSHIIPKLWFLPSILFFFLLSSLKNMWLKPYKGSGPTSRAAASFPSEPTNRRVKLFSA